MKVSLPYGREQIEIELPDKNLIGVLKTSRPSMSTNEEYEVRRSLENPVTPFIKKGSKALLIVTDYTRATPLSKVLPPIIQKLKEEGFKDFTVLVANGLHEPASQNQLEELLGGKVFEEAEIVNHDASKTDELTYLGETSWATPLWVNSRIFEADLKIGCGTVEPHFFAGYSGGGKIILPGISGIETIYRNHSYAMINHPSSRLGVLNRNIIYRDICEASSMSELDAVVNVVLSSEGGISKCFSGEPIKTHRSAVEFIERSIKAKAEKRADIVVVSGGGYPADRNLYQAVKGMAVGELLVKTNGVIVLLAECRDGVAHKHFYQLFSKFKNPADLLKHIKDHEPIRDQWEAQIMARILTKSRIVVYAKGVTAQELENMMLIPASSPEEALEIAFSLTSRNAELLAVPEGTHIIPEAPESNNT
ncbi:nickel-dependent lactate racemase [Candidatus Bathyarchaeota archaeon]|nr:nickel-dependent lactate racemase [Candidatus Bathyarchaeota archaeon]MBS7613430.1 nickel-dependent lactate racemase [Candidatus Bathyarchaeota archaeon]MBS7618872.1 nickel-dependent lactate racemase [Candidatus Bathyarchaeota archaeon]